MSISSFFLFQSPLAKHSPMLKWLQSRPPSPILCPCRTPFLVPAFYYLLQ